MQVQIYKTTFDLQVIILKNYFLCQIQIQGQIAQLAVLLMFGATNGLY